MIAWLSKLIDKASEYFAHRKGLLPMIGLLFILINLILQFLLPPGWLKESNLILHIGLIITIFGFVLARAL
jgi:hypothetical protein